MNVEIIQFRKFHDDRGNLSFFEVNDTHFFPINRVYWLYDVPQFASRGAHAHKALEQIMICVKGSLKIELDDGIIKKSFILDNPTVGLRIGKMTWREIKNFSLDAVLIVFASEKYKEEDYYRNYEEFLSACKVS